MMTVRLSQRMSIATKLLKPEGLEEIWSRGLGVNVTGVFFRFEIPAREAKAERTGHKCDRNNKEKGVRCRNQMGGREDATFRGKFAFHFFWFFVNAQNERGRGAPLIKR